MSRSYKNRPCGNGRFWREADIRQDATRGLGAKFAELVEASALEPGRDAIEPKIVPNPCALIISPLHSEQYQIFFAVTSRAAANPFLCLGDLRAPRTCTASLSVRKVRCFGVRVR